MNAQSEHRRLIRLCVGMQCMGMQLEAIASRLELLPGGAARLIAEAYERCEPKDRSEPGAIYVLGAVGACCVKIGWSGDVSARIKNISTMLPHEPLLVGIAANRSQNEERQIHKRLAKWQMRGEWFHLTSESRFAIAEETSVLIDDTHAELIGFSTAQQGRRIDDSTKRTLERLREAGRSIRESAKVAEVAKSTAQKYLKK